MKKLLLLLILMLVIPTYAVAAARQITAMEAKAMLDKNKRVYLLDVRTPQEYKQAYLKGSVLIPVDQLRRRWSEVPKDQPVIVYCAVGSRSGFAADFLVGQGYREVYNMSDGIVGWYRHGLPVAK